MKKILTFIAAGALLAAYAIAQPLPAAERALNTRNWTPPHAGRGHGRDSNSSLLVYVITVGFQFGAVDLRSGTFVPIGPGLPPDVGTGLVAGRGTTLLSLGFSGNLDAIDPFTGTTTVVGPTGLGDCLTPTSACGPNSPNVIGSLGESFYVTDFANNLYSLNPKTAATRLIGPTGIPQIPIPFSPNPDGTVNVYAESLFSTRGGLYATFATATLDPETGALKTVIPGRLYQINPGTGQAKWIAPTSSSLTSVVNVNDTIYAFDAGAGEVVTLDVRTGETTPVIPLDDGAGVIAGAALPPHVPGRSD